MAKWTRDDYGCWALIGENGLQLGSLKEWPQGDYTFYATINPRENSRDFDAPSLEDAKRICEKLAEKEGVGWTSWN